MFKLDSLKLPIKQHERELKIFLKNSPADLLSKPVFYSTMSTQVMNLIGGAIDQPFPLLETVARYFHMSARNLRRRLTEEGTSYQQIKNRLRKEKAMSLLDENKWAISQISRQVGFNESAGFTRAFKQWTDYSPRAYRELNDT